MFEVGLQSYMPKTSSCHRRANLPPQATYSAIVNAHAQKTRPCIWRSTSSGSEPKAANVELARRSRVVAKPSSKLQSLKWEQHGLLRKEADHKRWERRRRQRRAVDRPPVATASHSFIHCRKLLASFRCRVCAYSKWGVWKYSQNLKNHIIHQILIVP